MEAGIDPNHDGNAFSFYFYSRLDIHLSGGTAFDCEDLRDPDAVRGLPGSARHRIRVYEYAHKRLVRRVARPVSGCAQARRTTHRR